MFWSKRQGPPKLDGVLAAAAMAGEDRESEILWATVERCLMPEGGTVEALEYPSPGNWIGKLRTPGQPITFFDAKTSRMARLGALLKSRYSL